MRPLNILITGANGFLGANLIERINTLSGNFVYKFNKENSFEELDQLTKNCDFVFHLAAIHRPKHPSEFITTNCDLTKRLVDSLYINRNFCPILLPSSIQALDNNDYGRSKLMAESIIKNHSIKTGSKVYIYRLTNTFGKWAIPNQHSVVATFCYNILNNIPITISDPSLILNLYYVDDVIDLFIEKLFDNHKDNFNYSKLEDNLTYSVSLLELSDLIHSFNESLKNGKQVNVENDFHKKLYNTFLSYIL